MPTTRSRVDDLQRWEQRNGPIPADAILLLRTGFSRRWPDAARYLGTAERGESAVPKLHFPGLHPDAAKWIVANRPIKAIGIDTASIDYGQSSLFETHRTLYARNIPAFENLTALERLPATGAYLVALPMKIKGGSGAPLRAMAILPTRYHARGAGAPALGLRSERRLQVRRAARIAHGASAGSPLASLRLQERRRADRDAAVFSIQDHTWMNKRRPNGRRSCSGERQRAANLQ